jgi:hypothetical protein
MSRRSRENRPIGPKCYKLPKILSERLGDATAPNRLLHNFRDAVTKEALRLLQRCGDIDFDAPSYS